MGENMLVIKKYIKPLFIGFLLILILWGCEKDVSKSQPVAPVPITRIFINSNPAGAKIYENGRNSGRVTPDTLKWLEADTYQFTLRLENYRDTNFYAEVKSDEMSEFYIDFHTNPKMMGKIICRPDEDSAAIYLDGIPTGSFTPDTLYNVIPGPHTIMYKKAECRDLSKDLMVKSNEFATDYSDIIDTSLWVDYNFESSLIPSIRMSCIEIDDADNIWIGSTDNGLIKFDGEFFSHYHAGNTILESDFINNIEIDSNGKIWISTYKGLYTFDGAAWDVFSTKNYFPTDVINDVKFGNDGRIYVATQRGLMWTEPNTLHKWNIYFEIIYPANPNDPQPDLLASDILSIDINHEKNLLWVGSRRGNIHVLKAGNWTKLLDPPLNEGTFISHMLAVSNGVLVSRATDPQLSPVYGGVTKFVQLSLTFPDVGHWQKRMFGLTGVDVYDLYAADGEFWVSTYRGLLHSRNNIHTMLNVNNTELKTNYIVGSRKDSKGNIWVISKGLGLYRYKFYLDQP